MIAGGNPDYIDEMHLEELGGGRYRGRLTPGFTAARNPQGGVSTALGVHAAARTLGRDDQHLRSFHITFVGQLPEGPVEVETNVLREGRAASQVSAKVRPADGSSPGHHVVVTFGAELDIPATFADTGPLEVPGPDGLTDRWGELLAESPSDDPATRAQQPSFMHHFEVRGVNTHSPADDDWEPSPGPIFMWMRWKDTPTASDGTTSALAIPPIMDMMPPAVMERLGPIGWYMAPSADLYGQLFDTRLDESGWVLLRLSSRWAGGGMAAGQAELFTPDGRLVAFTTQLMHLRPVDVGIMRARMAGGTEGASG